MSSGLFTSSTTTTSWLSWVALPEVHVVLLLVLLPLLPRCTAQTSHPCLYDSSSESFQQSNESRLVAHLRNKYLIAGTVARPLLNSSQSMKVEFALALIQILDFDETNQVLTTNVWKRYRWRDEILVWNPEQFGGITDISLPSGEVWTPDIVLYNNADEQEKTHQELVSVSCHGLVQWVPPAIYKSSCQLDMTNFPFDEQTCTFKFGSWTYDGNRLDLMFYDNLTELDVSEYINSSEWQLLATNATHNIRYYPCCADEPYPDITFSLTVKRRTAFYIYVLILPSVLLSTLTLVLFWIPPQRPDRTSLGMSLFSSFFVLLLILVQSSPPTSASISLLGLYYCINMIMIAFSTMLSAIVINLTTYLQRRPVPAVVRMICVYGLGRALCATDVQVTMRDGIMEQAEEEPMMSKASQLNGSSGSRLDRQGINSTGSLSRSHQREWRVVASVIDRLFFLIYVAGMIVSFIFVFPR